MFALFFASYGGQVSADQEAGYRLPVRTWNALRYANTHRQSHDFTCGAASLSTLMRYFLQMDVVEEQVLAQIRTSYPDKEAWGKAEAEGLSMLDLARAAEAYGLRASAYRLNLEEVAKLTYPVIVHLDKEGYRHFSVLKGVSQQRAWLADPIRGNFREPIGRFATEWSGLVLIIWDPAKPPHHGSALDFDRTQRLAENDLRDSVIRSTVLPQATFNPYAR